MTVFGSSGGDRPKPPFLSRLRDRPRLPVEFVNMSDEEYTQILTDSGYGEPFIKEELKKLEEYRQAMAPPPVAPVTEGPAMTEQYAAWLRRRRQQAGEGSEEDAEPV